MKTSFNIKMEEDLRDQAKELFETIGLDLTTAVNLFLRAAIREKGLPFPLSLAEGGVDVEKLQRRWSAQLKEAEHELKAGEELDFHEVAAEIKRDYGLN